MVGLRDNYCPQQLKRIVGGNNYLRASASCCNNLARSNFSALTRNAVLKIFYFITNIPNDGFIPVTMEHHFQRIQFIARNTTIHFDKAVLQVSSPTNSDSA